MNVNDYNISIDYSNKSPMKCESKLIALTRNISCSECDHKSNFDAMISDGNLWRCIQCWENVGSDVISENMKEKLSELSSTVRKNYIIRNI